MAAGGVLIWGFVTWQRHREETGRDPLVHLSLARIPPVRSGLIGMFSQNLVLMGIFFVVPLYLQLVLGLSALETGIKMLPISITMFATAAVGARLSNRFPVRAIVQTGLIVTLVGALMLLSTIKPTLSNAGFAIGMAVLGVGMGLMISQLGNVVQSSVDESGRSEAGGLQYTGQQLGSSLGVALIGAIVLIGLTSTFISNVEHDPRISAEVSAQVGVAAGSKTNFVASYADRGCGTEGRPRRGDNGGVGRRLRVGTAPIAQGRSSGGCAPRPHLAWVHEGASPRTAGSATGSGYSSCVTLNPTGQPRLSLKAVRFGVGTHLKTQHPTQQLRSRVS